MSRYDDEEIQTWIRRLTAGGRQQLEAVNEISRVAVLSRPTRFGTVQEAENQIITDYEVYAERPVDSDLRLDSIRNHEQQLGPKVSSVASIIGSDGFAKDRSGELAAKAESVCRNEDVVWIAKNAAIPATHTEEWGAPHFLFGTEWSPTAKINCRRNHCL